jgi:glycosyltransferase involved in cell wall biosynthesis
MSVRPDRLGGRNVLVMHPRRHHLYHTALAYRDAGRLAGFLTEVYVGRPGLLAPLRKLAMAWVANKLSAYHHPELTQYVRVSPAHPALGWLWRALGAATVARRGRSWAQVAADLVRDGHLALHGCCSQAQDAFALCKADGAPCVLEQYIGDRRAGRQLLLDEFAHWGLPVDEPHIHYLGFSQAKIDINEREYALADSVIAGSAFVRDTLVAAGVPAERVVLAPYGVESDVFTPQFTERRANEPLRVAFVGTGGVRKGVLYLLQAAQRLGPQRVQVHVFGNLLVPEAMLRPYNDILTQHGHLARGMLIAELGQCHAMALPSLWEGSAYAVLEAMAMGLPPVVTPNTGSVVRDGEEGFIVPIRDSDAIAAALARLADDETARRTMMRRARATAQQQTWAIYGQTLVQGLSLAPGR